MLGTFIPQTRVGACHDVGCFFDIGWRVGYGKMSVLVSYECEKARHDVDCGSLYVESSFCKRGRSSGKKKKLGCGLKQDSDFSGRIYILFYRRLPASLSLQMMLRLLMIRHLILDLQFISQSKALSNQRCFSKKGNDDT